MTTVTRRTFLGAAAGGTMLAGKMGLRKEQRIVLAQTVGYPK